MEKNLLLGNKKMNEMVRGVSERVFSSKLASNIFFVAMVILMAGATTVSYTHLTLPTITAV